MCIQIAECTLDRSHRPGFYVAEEEGGERGAAAVAAAAVGVLGPDASSAAAAYRRSLLAHSGPSDYDVRIIGLAVIYTHPCSFSIENQYGNIQGGA
jgi:hypothetical protein